MSLDIDEQIERLEVRLAWLDEWGERPDEADEARRVRTELRQLRKEAVRDE
jgi:hypothetical protein